MQQEILSCPTLPLAVYREIAAHLQQVDGVRTKLIPQSSQTFEYTQSQIESLWIQYPENFDTPRKQQVEAILDYYAQRHGSWQRLETK